MPPLDMIRLRGLVVFGHHGARPEEQALGQNFEVDVDIQADLSLSRSSDRLEDTIDYGAVHDVVREVVAGPPRNLLERLADEIASRILDEFDVAVVKVAVKKPRLAIKGAPSRSVSVEVTKERG